VDALKNHLFVGRLSRELWAKERPQLWMAKLGSFWATEGFWAGFNVPAQ
jgi:hypothetical protein